MKADVPIKKKETKAKGIQYTMRGVSKFFKGD